MTDDTSDYVEKTFKTVMQLEPFQKMAKRTCRAPFWVTVEARDRTEIPFTQIFSTIFSTVEDRDRFTIALRFAEEQQRPAAAKPSAGKQYASA
jgi:hypothetical protein